MKIILVLIMAASLVGCAHNQPQVVYETIKVEVPVYQVPTFEIPEQPVLPVDQLTEADIGNHEKIGKAYVKSINILKYYSNSLKDILEGMRGE